MVIKYLPKNLFFCKKIFLLLPILLIINISTINCNDDCKSPCLVKTMDKIKSDRKEMYSLRDQMINMITDINNKLDRKFSEFKTEIDMKISEISSNMKNQINSLTSNITDSFSHIKEEFDVLKDDLTNGIEKKNNLYFEKEALIYDNIFTALEKGIVAKNGNPIGWDDLLYRKNPWNGKLIMCIGSNSQENGAGMKIIIPENYNVLWLRVHNDNNWNVYRFSYLDGNKEILPKFASGHRYLNEISPDGGASDSYDSLHMWVPIPIPRSGILLAQSDYDSGHWISGIAFSKNLWGHAKNSALAYHWKLNGGSNIGWDSGNWNNDVLGLINKGVVPELIVPVVENGKDKLLYIVEHNNNWNGIMHTAVYVNGVKIERFRASYINPFAMHTNSKFYNRYIATKIPKELIKKGDNTISVKIDMTFQNNNIYFREVGTHDYI